RRRKAVKLLAKSHQKVRRQRRDFHHKTALALVRANDAIYYENLQTANMVKNHHLAKSISDAGGGAFLIYPDAQGSMGRSQDRRCQSGVYLTGLQRVGSCGCQRLIRPLALLPGLWNEPTQRPQRGQEYRAAWAKPSGRRGIGHVAELRSPRL